MKLTRAVPPVTVDGRADPLFAAPAFWPPVVDDPFLAAIIADPCDDAPRLVYADFLEERGDPRGWFIRFQCEPWNQGIHAGDREYALLERHASEWFPFLQPLTGRKRQKFPGPDGYLADYGPPNLVLYAGRPQGRYGQRRRFELHVRRGFIAHVEMAAADWLDHGTAIAAASPLERVELTLFDPYRP